MKKAFVLYKDSLEVLKEMTDDQAGKLFKAIAYYQETGELPEMDLLTRIAISPFINHFKRDEEKYEQTTIARAKAGSLGGKISRRNKQKEANKANAYFDKQTQANKADKDIVIDKEIDKEIDKDFEDVKTSSSSGSKINNFITPSMFDDFWKLYPRKVDKGKTLKKWLDVCKKPNKDKPTWRQIKRAIIYQTKSERWQTEKYIPHPTTWLNNMRWLDDASEMKVFQDDKPSTPNNKWKGYTGKEDNMAGTRYPVDGKC